VPVCSVAGLQKLLAAVGTQPEFVSVTIVGLFVSVFEPDPAS
jgi:hypothetical protein